MIVTCFENVGNILYQCNYPFWIVQVFINGINFKEVTFFQNIIFKSPSINSISNIYIVAYNLAHKIKNLEKVKLCSYNYINTWFPLTSRIKHFFLTLMTQIA